MKHIRLFEGFDQLNEEMYTVMNVTDGIPASPEVFTEEKADKFIQEFPKRFRGQGYYLTSNNERIDPYDIKLEKVPVESGATEGTYEAKENITMRGQYGDFKLEKGEQIHISPGKMSKNDYTVKMPDGVTQIKAEPINDLISAGRLQPIENTNENIDNDEEIGEITKALDDAVKKNPKAIDDIIENTDITLAGRNIFYKQAQEMYHEDVISWEKINKLSGLEKIKSNEKFNRWTEDNKSLIMSKAYHKAKIEKINPRLVRGVENLLGVTGQLLRAENMRAL